MLAFVFYFQCDRNLFWSYAWYWQTKSISMYIFKVAPKMVTFCRNWSVIGQYLSLARSAVFGFLYLFLSLSFLIFLHFELHVKRFNINWINKQALQHTSNELKFMFYIGFEFGLGFGGLPFCSLLFGLFWLLLLLHKCRWKETIILAENTEWIVKMIVTALLLQPQTTRTKTEIFFWMALLNAIVTRLGCAVLCYSQSSTNESGSTAYRPPMCHHRIHCLWSVRPVCTELILGIQNERTIRGSRVHTMRPLTHDRSLFCFVFRCTDW